MSITNALPRMSGVSFYFSVPDILCCVQWVWLLQHFSNGPYTTEPFYLMLGRSDFLLFDWFVVDFAPLTPYQIYNAVSSGFCYFDCCSISLMGLRPRETFHLLLGRIDFLHLNWFAVDFAPLPHCNYSINLFLFYILSHRT